MAMRLSISRARSPPQLLRLGPGVNAAGGRHGLLRQTLPIRLLHLTVRGVVPLREEALQGRHEVGQQNGPAEIQRDQLGPVQQQKEGFVLPLRPWRDHVQPHHARTLGVQCDMANAAQVLLPEFFLTTGDTHPNQPSLPCYFLAYSIPYLLKCARTSMGGGGSSLGCDAAAQVLMG